MAQKRVRVDRQRALALAASYRWVLISTLFCVCAAAGFVGLTSEVFAESFVRLDQQMVRGAYSWRSPVLNLVMAVFTMLGGTLALTAWISLGALLLMRQHHWIEAFGLIGAWGGASLLNWMLKLSFERVRPDSVPVPFNLELASYSYPSAHAMGSFVCYGILLFLVLRRVQRPLLRLLLMLGTVLLVVSIGASRVYLGLHFPTDVLGGFLAGAIWLVITITSIWIAELHIARRRAAAKIS